MSEAEIKQYIKDNLSIKIVVERGSYGSRNDIAVQLVLDEECISEDYIEIPSED